MTPDILISTLKQDMPITLSITRGEEPCLLALQGAALAPDANHLDVPVVWLKGKLNPIVALRMTVRSVHALAVLPADTRWARVKSAVAKACTRACVSSAASLEEGDGVLALRECDLAFPPAFNEAGAVMNVGGRPIGIAKRPESGATT